MKRTLGVLAFALVVGLAGHAYSDDTKAAAKDLPGWSKLASLVGEWDSKTEDGKAVHVKFELVAGGSVLLEAMEGCCGSMVTMYHGDKDHVILTHYCCAGNQPRMKLVKATEKELEFEFLDCTNLEKPGDPHMHGLVVRFKDEKHYTEEWTFRAGEKSEKKVLEYERKK